MSVQISLVNKRACDDDGSVTDGYFTKAWRNWTYTNDVNSFNIVSKLAEISATISQTSYYIEFDTEADAMMWLLRWS